MVQEAFKMECNVTLKMGSSMHDVGPTYSGKTRFITRLMIIQSMYSMSCPHMYIGVMVVRSKYIII